MTHISTPPTLAQLVARSRTLGADRSVCNWGGGNTSAKSDEIDFRGRPARVLWVKGSGSDLASVTEASFTGLFLDDVLPLLERERMSDSEMVDYLAHCFSEPGRPRPSIETLLHGFLPFTHIDHTHAVHCLSRNLTLRSSRDTPSGIIVAFSIIPPLHSFPLAEKTGSPYNAFQGVRFLVRQSGRKELSSRQRYLAPGTCKGGDHERRNASRKPGANSFSTCSRSIARHRRSRRRANCWMPLPQRPDTIASTRCGSSTMRKWGNPHLSIPAHAITGQKSNTRCSWFGTPPTASVPNVSCPFSPHCSKRWSGMSIST